MQTLFFTLIGAILFLSILSLFFIEKKAKVYITVFWVLFFSSPFFIFYGLTYLGSIDNEFKDTELITMVMAWYLVFMSYYVFKSFVKGDPQKKAFAHLWGMPIASLPVGFSPRFYPYKLAKVIFLSSGDIEIMVPGKKKDIDFEDKPELSHGKSVKALRMPVNDNDDQQISCEVNGEKEFFDFVTAPTNPHTNMVDPYRLKMILSPIFQVVVRIPDNNIGDFISHYTNEQDAIEAIIEHVTGEALTVFSKKTFATLAANQDLLEEYLRKKFSLKGIEVVRISIVDFGLSERVSKEAAELITSVIKNQEKLQTAETEAVSKRKEAQTRAFVTETDALAEAIKNQTLNEVENANLEQKANIETEKLRNQAENTAIIKAMEEQMMLEAQGDGLKAKAEKLGVAPNTILTMDTIMEFAKANPNILLNLGGGSPLEALIQNFLLNPKK